MCGCVVDCVEFAADDHLDPRELFYTKKQSLLQIKKQTKLRSDGQKQSL